MLPYGNGRSYGDVPINAGNALISTCRLKRFLRFDSECGALECEAGVTFEEIIQLALPMGWFLPVTPGTQYLTVGGAIANDIHGKNHFHKGTIGCHIRSFRLLRSDNSLIWCSHSKNAGLFAATIGGLGLTGMIVSAEIQLLKVESSNILSKEIPFPTIRDGIQLLLDSEGSHQYTVAWVDTTAKNGNRGRGILSLGDHLEDGIFDVGNTHNIRVPFNLPKWTLNRFSVSAFNQFYYYLHGRPKHDFIQNYRPFFYPLDSVQNWNRIYGKPGFYQYQFVLPMESSLDIENVSALLDEVLSIISEKGSASFLSVLKTFGSIKSPGMLSFPVRGITLAMDFPNRGRETLKLLKELDAIVVPAGGKIYPAKDARMPPEVFKRSYSRLSEFHNWIDPNFSSSFWRRVNEAWGDR